MRARTLFILAVTTTALIATAPAAFAHRPATQAERAAMLYHPGNRTGEPGPVGEPRSFPARCALADIATVVKGSQWGGYTFDNHAAGCSRFGFDGISVEHQIRGRWYVLWEGSEGFPTNVPRPIFNDISHGLSAAF